MWENKYTMAACVNDTNCAQVMRPSTEMIITIVVEIVTDAGGVTISTGNNNKQSSNTLTRIHSLAGVMPYPAVK